MQEILDKYNCFKPYDEFVDRNKFMGYNFSNGNYYYETDNYIIEISNGLSILPKTNNLIIMDEGVDLLIEVSNLQNNNRISLARYRRMPSYIYRLKLERIEIDYAVNIG